MSNVKYYKSSSGGEMLISEMATPHIENAIRKIERDPRQVSGMNRTLVALQSELAIREAEAQAEAKE